MRRASCFCHRLDPVYLPIEIPIAHTLLVPASPLPQALVPIYLKPDSTKCPTDPFPEGFQMPAEWEYSGVIYWPLQVFFFACLCENGLIRASCGLLACGALASSLLPVLSLSLLVVLFKPCPSFPMRASSSVFSVCWLACERKGCGIKGSFGVSGPGPSLGLPYLGDGVWRERPLPQSRARESISQGSCLRASALFLKISKDVPVLCGTGSNSFSLWSVGYFWVVPCGFSRARHMLRSRDPSEKACVLRG